MNDKINEDIKNAMKSKDTFRLSVLRMLKSALQMESIAKKHELDDNEVISVIKKQVKLRRDSLDEYQKYGKTDSVESLKQEITILSEYLPEEIGEEELLDIVNSIITELSASSMKDMGRVMKTVNQRLDGKNADMSKVSQLVKTTLNNN